MTLLLQLPPELEQRLDAAAQAQGVPPAEYALQVLEEKLSDAERRRQSMEMLRAWRDEGDPEEDRRSYEELTKALDADRSSDRKLFPPELEGISW